jgi:tight adherence protein B
MALALLPPLCSALAVLCAILGAVHLGAVRVRQPARAVADAAGQPDMPPGWPDARAGVPWAGVPPGGRVTRSAARLPRPLHYVARRARAAGVDWSLTTVLLLVVSAGLGSALLLLLVTGVPWMAAAAFCAGFYAPVWQLGRVASRRAQQILGQLDQVCTGLIQSLSGGLDPHAALLRQAEHAPDPVGAELRRLMQRVRDGEPLVDAVAELPDRIALDEARFFSVGIRLAMDAGTRVVPVLESVQRSLRSRREMHGLVRELSARDERQAVILLFVPAVMLLAMRLEAPVYTAPLFHSATGQLLLAGDVAWMVAGVQLIRSFFAATPLQ